MPEKNNAVFRSVATVTVFSVFTRALSFIFKIYLSRALGAEVMGLYQICLSVFYLFASFSASGIPLVLSRKTAENRALGKTEGFSLITSALVLGIIISVSTAVVLALCKPYLGSILKNEKTIPMFLVMLPALVSTTIYGILRGFFWGRKEFTAFSVTETVEEILRIIFTAFFVSGLISGISGAYGIAVAFTVSDLLVAAVLLVMYLAKGGKFDKPSKLKEILLPAVPVTLMRIFGGLISALTAVLLPARLMASGLDAGAATADFGRIGGMANPLLLAPNAIITSLTIVLIPEMSANKVQNRYGTLNRQLNNGINFSFIISGIFMLFYFALGEELTSFLYHDAASGQYLKIASLIMLPMCINQLTQSCLNSIGRELNAFINYAVSTILTVACIYLLPQYIGIYSVAVASGASILCGSILNLVCLKKHTGFSVGFLKNLVLIPVFAVPCAYFSENLYSLTSSGGTLVSLLVAAIGAFIMYAALCLITETVDIKGFIELKSKKC